MRAKLPDRLVSRQDVPDRGSLIEAKLLYRAHREFQGSWFSDHLKPRLHQHVAGVVIPESHLLLLDYPKIISPSDADRQLQRFPYRKTLLRSPPLGSRKGEHIPRRARLALLRATDNLDDVENLEIGLWWVVVDMAVAPVGHIFDGFEHMLQEWAVGLALLS